MARNACLNTDERARSRPLRSDGEETHGIASSPVSQVKAAAARSAAQPSARPTDPGWRPRTHFFARISITVAGVEPGFLNP
jgi:hypothetical protein